MPGLDTIEVSGIDLTRLGHGYFADARDVLHDIYDFLVNHMPPNRRMGLKRLEMDATHLLDDYGLTRPGISVSQDIGGSPRFPSSCRVPWSPSSAGVPWFPSSAGVPVVSVFRNQGWATRRQPIPTIR